MGNSKILRGLTMFMASCAAVIGMVSIVHRTGGYVSGEVAKTSQAKIVTAAESSTTVQTAEKVSTSGQEKSTQKTSETKQSKSNTTQPTTSNGKNYPVIEKQFGADGITYDNFSVKNYTDFNLNVADELKKNLGFKIDNSHKVQVLIFHTHTCESYLTDDTGYYPADYYPRSTEKDKNITSVGDKIEAQLKNAGIGVIHDKTFHDYPSYNGSYERSYNTIQKYMKKYKDIKVVLDIHRDAIGGGGEDGKVKPVFEYNGKKCAQVMIMTGYSYEGGGYFPFWEENLCFALKLQQTAETMYPGLTRPLNFGEYTYNLNVCNGSLLIEFGTDVNTIDEAQRSGTMMGKALAKVLQNS
ncbi:MAG: stage II sporulation protein P [Ruminococcus sp.]|nr:stage II sporulation protein P [Ruminococcus sp.]